MSDPTMPAPTPEKKPNRLMRLLAAVGAHELRTLLLLALISAGIWGFIALADEVAEGDTQKFDTRVLLALRTPGNLADPIGPSWVEEGCRDLTALGGTIVLTMLTLFSAGFLLLQRKRHAAWLLMGAVGSGFLASTALKLAFHRPRPDIVPYLSHTYSTSFPSGHSMMSALTYLTLGAILTRVVSGKILKAYLLLTAILLTFLVGFSRVYLGVHWLTDVLAGWTCGAVWAALCWLAARYLQRHGEVESAGEEAPPHT